MIGDDFWMQHKAAFVSFVNPLIVQSRGSRRTQRKTQSKFREARKQNSSCIELISGNSCNSWLKNRQRISPMRIAAKAAHQVIDLM